MKMHVDWLPLAAWVSFILFVSGCGGGGGGGGGSSTAGAQGSAPAAVAGKTIHLEGNGFTQDLRFAESGNSFSQFASGANTFTRSGTYQYAFSGNSATLTLTDSANSEVLTFHLTFGSPSAGSFTFESTSGVTGSGSFSVADSTAGSGSSGGTNPNPGSSGGTGGTTGGTTGGGNPGPNAGLDGRVMTLTRSTGQMHTYTFAGSTFVDSDPPEEGDGTYTFQRTGMQGQLTLKYTAASKSKQLIGDEHDIQMTFSDNNNGSYTSVYHTSDGANLNQDGTFHFMQ